MNFDDGNQFKGARSVGKLDSIKQLHRCIEPLVDPETRLEFTVRVLSNWQPEEPEVAKKRRQKADYSSFTGTLLRKISFCGCPLTGHRVGWNWLWHRILLRYLILADAGYGAKAAAHLRKLHVPGIRKYGDENRAKDTYLKSFDVWVYRLEVAQIFRGIDVFRSNKLVNWQSVEIEVESKGGNVITHIFGA